VTTSCCFWWSISAVRFTAVFWDSVIAFIELSVPSQWSWTVLHILRAGTISVILYRLVLVFNIYFVPGRWCKVLRWVCLSTCMSQKPHVQTSLNFLYMSPVAVARFSSDDRAICYVLPVLWLTSCFHIMEPVGQNQRRRTCFIQCNRWWHQSDIRWRS